MYCLKYVKKTTNSACLMSGISEIVHSNFIYKIIIIISINRKRLTSVKKIYMLLLYIIFILVFDLLMKL